MSRKKIIILTSKGGGGHISATHALQSYLGDDYDITVVHPFTEIFHNHDFTPYILGKSGEDAYNWFLNNRWHRTISLMYHMAARYFQLRHKKLTNLMCLFLEKEKPDLVISVVFLVNGVTLHACQQLDIPFLIIPTDLDIRPFLVGIKNPTYARFMIAAAFEDPLSLDTLGAAGILPAHLRMVGFPLRANFFQEHDAIAIKKKWSFPDNKPILLIMMGGQGALALIDYALALSKMATPAHLVICIGKCTKLGPQLSAIPFPDHITHSIIGYTDNIAHLMHVADLIITKSGSVSFCESIYSGKPILLDATTTILPWEQLNHHILKTRKFGDRVTSFNDLPRRVRSIQARCHEYQKNAKEYPKIKAPVEIPKIIKELLQSDSQP